MTGLTMLVLVMGRSWGGVFPFADAESGRLKRGLAAVLGGGVCAFLLFLLALIGERS